MESPSSARELTVSNPQSVATAKLHSSSTESLNSRVPSRPSAVSWLFFFFAFDLVSLANLLLVPSRPTPHTPPLLNASMYIYIHIHTYIHTYEVTYILTWVHSYPKTTRRTDTQIMNVHRPVAAPVAGAGKVNMHGHCDTYSGTRAVRRKRENRDCSFARSVACSFSFPLLI